MGLPALCGWLRRDYRTTNFKPTGPTQNVGRKDVVCTMKQQLATVLGLVELVIEAATRGASFPVLRLPDDDGAC